MAPAGRVLVGIVLRQMVRNAPLVGTVPALGIASRPAVVSVRQRMGKSVPSVGIAPRMVIASRPSVGISLHSVVIAMQMVGTMPVIVENTAGLVAVGRPIPERKKTLVAPKWE